MRQPGFEALRGRRRHDPARACPAYVDVGRLVDGRAVAVLPARNGVVDLRDGWVVEGVERDLVAATVTVGAAHLTDGRRWRLTFSDVEDLIQHRGGGLSDKMAGGPVVTLGASVAQLEVWVPHDSSRARWFRMVVGALDVVVRASGLALWTSWPPVGSAILSPEPAGPPVWCDPEACRVCGDRSEVFYEAGDPLYSICRRCGAESGVDEYSVVATARYRHAWLTGGMPRFTPERR